MRAAFFDLDETILDRSGSLTDFVTWQATGMLRTCISDVEHFVARFIALDQNGMVWKDQVYETLINEFSINDWSVDDLLNVYLLAFCAFCKPRQGALAAIKEFHRNGFKIGLISNGKTPFQERNFEALGFGQFFDCVVVSDAVKVRKPDKEIFELACSRISVDIESSVFIGDNPISDIKGAKDAGMTTVYVPTNPDHELCLYADSTFNELTELASYINPGLL